MDRHSSGRIHSRCPEMNPLPRRKEARAHLACPRQIGSKQKIRPREEKVVPRREQRITGHRDRGVLERGESRFFPASLAELPILHQPCPYFGIAGEHAPPVACNMQFRRNFSAEYWRKCDVGLTEHQIGYFPVLLSTGRLDDGEVQVLKRLRPCPRERERPQKACAISCIEAGKVQGSLQRRLGRRG